MGMGKFFKPAERSRSEIKNLIKTNGFRLRSVGLFLFIMPLFSIASLANASPLLDALKSKTTDAQSISGNFTQHKIIKGLSIPLISKGEFSYSKEEKLVWHIQTPIENTYSIEYSQITKKSAIEDIVEGLDASGDQYQKIITMFLDLFSGNWGVLDQYFEINGDSSQSGWNATLIPKDQLFKTMFVSMELQGNEHIDSMFIQEKNGDKTQIEFSQVQVVPAKVSSTETPITKRTGD